MRETPIGPWVLLDFEPNVWREEYGVESGLSWVGPSCVLDNGKQYALARYEQAIDLSRRGAVDDDLICMFEEVVDAYRYFTPAMMKLSELHQLRGDDVSAQSWRARLRRLRLPSVEAHVRFEHGIELLGLSAEPSSVGPGDRLELSYYWRIPPQAARCQPAVFVHITKNGCLFQDDHVLLAGTGESRLAFQPFDEVYPEFRTIQIPETAATGTYHIAMGLVEPATGRRLRCRTKLPHRKRAVQIPFSLMVRGQGTGGRGGGTE